MTSANTLRCATCLIDIAGMSYVTRGEAYCCRGCSRGGPCTCLEDRIVDASGKEAASSEPSWILTRSQASAPTAAPDPSELSPFVTAAGDPGTTLVDDSEIDFEALLRWARRSAADDGIDTAPDDDRRIPPELVETATRLVVVGLTPDRAESYLDLLRDSLGAAPVAMLDQLDDRAVFEILGYRQEEIVSYLMGAKTLGVAGLKFVGQAIELTLEPGFDPHGALMTRSMPASSQPAPARSPRSQRPGAGWYELGADMFFNARHYVTINGVKGPVHPHSWKVRVSLQENTLDQNGLLVGFAEVKGKVQKEIGRFDNTLLNSVPPFDRLQPTSENVAAVIYHELESALQQLPVKLRYVGVWETPTNYVQYSEEDT